MDFTIADRLVELRRAHGYSQEGLAAELGLTRQAVSRWERGESLPDTENLIALADLYGVSLDELVRPLAQGAGEPAPGEPDAEDELEENPAAEAEPVPETMSAPSMTGHERGCLIAAVVVAVLVAALFLLGAILGAINYLSFQPSSGVVETGGAVGSMSEHFDSGQVHDLRINWGLGPVIVKQVDAEETGGSVLVEEEYLDAGFEAYPMKTHLSGGELVIDYGVNGTVFQGNHGKRLTVLVPEGEATLGDVRFSIANDELDLRNLACETLCIQLASGVVQARKVTAEQLDLEVSSGDATVDGSFARSVTVELGSGDALVSTDVMPHDTSMQVASGDAVLKLPRKAGFTAQVQVSSGDFDLDFASQKQGDAYVVGHGENRVDVSVTSGSVRIAQR